MSETDRTVSELPDEGPIETLDQRKVRRKLVEAVKDCRVAAGGVRIGSSSLLSLARKWIRSPIRIAVYIVIIATFVTVVDFSLAAYLPMAHWQFGAFIAVIIVNCPILGRLEAFAAKYRAVLAVADAIGTSAGFTLGLASIGAIREILGSGSPLG